MNQPMTPVDPDSPLMKAWEEYQETEDFENTKHWAEHVVHPHLQGSMWALFMNGFLAGKQETDAELRKILQAATDALRSYQYGNSSQELAKKIADACEAALAEITPADVVG